MTPAARVQTAIELLDLILTSDRPADGAIAEGLRGRRYMGSKDRGVVVEEVYRVLRRLGRLMWWCRHLHTPADGRTLLILDLAGGERCTPEKIAALFSGDRYSPRGLSDTEQFWIQQMAAAPSLTTSTMTRPVALECPDWAWPLMRERFGERVEEELLAMAEPATLDLRVNALRATRDQVQAALAKDEIESEPTPLSPWGLRVAGRRAIQQTEAFKQGWVEVQDEGSQLIAAVCAAKPGERVVDFCAGAGGKTLALAATMANKGSIVAADVLEGRLKRARVRLTRAGVDTVTLRPLKDVTDPWIKRHKRGYDLVLVDAPCSGSGTWRRNPDARWRDLGPGLEELMPLQQSILASAARLVKPGGRLVYATCSLFPEENEQQISAFLESTPEFEQRPVFEPLADVGVPLDHPALIDSSVHLSLSPARAQTDGFFAALLQRKPD